jgi:chromosome segregation ATPase
MKLRATSNAPGKAGTGCLFLLAIVGAFIFKSVKTSRVRHNNHAAINSVPEVSEPEEEVGEQATPVSLAGTSTTTTATPTVTASESLRGQIASCQKEINQELKSIQSYREVLAKIPAEELGESVRKFHQRIADALASNKVSEGLTKARSTQQSLVMRHKDLATKFSQSAKLTTTRLLDQSAKDLQEIEQAISGLRAHCKGMDEKLNSLIIFHDQVKKISGAKAAGDQLRSELNKLPR